MWLASLCAIVLDLACAVVSDNTDNLFIFPTAPGPSSNYVANLVWTLGSTQNIQWTTTVQSYYIALFQQINDPPSGIQLQTIYTSDSSGGGQQSFNWRVQTYDADRSISPVYYLFLNSGDTQRFTSHYFNITTQAQSSSSLSSSSSSSISITALTSSTPLPTSMIASTSLSVPLQKSSDTAPASPSSASSNTETVKVGLGVGLGLGIPLVLIAGIWIGLKMVKARQPSSRDTGSAVPLSQFPQGYPHDPSPTLKDSFHQADPIHEAPGESRKPHEAPREGALLELG